MEFAAEHIRVEGERVVSLARLAVRLRVVHVCVQLLESGLVVGRAQLLERLASTNGSIGIISSRGMMMRVVGVVTGRAGIGFKVNDLGEASSHIHAKDRP